MRRKHIRHRHVGRDPAEGFRYTKLQYCLIAALIVCGVVWGSVLASRAGIENENSFGLLLQQMLSKSAASKGFWNLFFSSFFSSSLLLCVAFILGLCAVGSPGHVALALFKGAGIGVSMSFIYASYGVKGFAICALFILPWAVITSLAVLLACREGIRFSVLMARAVLPVESPAHLWNEFTTYCFKFVFCFGLVLIAAAVEAASTMIFSMLFFS